MNTKKMAFTVTLVLIALLFLGLFGCTSPQAEKDNLTKFTSLQQKYFVVAGYSSSLTTMNDYISALSLLRASSTGSSAKIIEAELYSAQAFYYLNKTMVDSAPIDYKQIKCNSTEVKNIISTINLASEYSAKAVIAINGLNADQQTALRTNQLQTVLGQQESINEIKKFFEEKC
jgi:hypothetical protein